MNVNTIKDTIKALAQSLQLTTILPASLFVFVNTYLILPHLWSDFDPKSSYVVTLAVSLTLMGSYTLYAFNFPLIRFLEGYKVRDSDWGQSMLRKKREKFNALLGRIDMLGKRRILLQNRLGFAPGKAGGHPLDNSDANDLGSVISQLVELEYTLDRHYPSTVHAVLPTRLGNTIAAFEDYPRTRYGIETFVLWPRLVPVLKEAKYTEFITQEKSVFDFLLNTFVVVVALGIELVYLSLFLGHFVYATLIGFVASGVSYTLYWGMIIQARQWGTTVRVAFDLYRYDLRRRLGLYPAKTFEEEYHLWQRVSRFLLYRRRDIWFNGFISQYEMEKTRRKEKGAKEVEKEIEETG